jgi:hypothetical protein
MADQSHLDILQQGAEAWNSWRDRNPTIEPNLSEADLSGANLSRANLSGTNLTQEQVELAQGDENTQLPSHLKPSENWSVKTDEQPEED